ncbi:MAG: hypothetical protein ACRDQ7_18635, partial [Haloechinothrix sp.]
MGCRNFLCLFSIHDYRQEPDRAGARGVAGLDHPAVSLVDREMEMSDLKGQLDDAIGVVPPSRIDLDSLVK